MLRTSMIWGFVIARSAHRRKDSVRPVVSSQYHCLETFGGLLLPTSAVGTYVSVSCRLRMIGDFVAKVDKREISAKNLD